MLKIQLSSSEIAFSAPTVEREGPTVSVLLEPEVEIVDAEDGKSALVCCVSFCGQCFARCPQPLHFLQ
eukprot:2731765-Alexandrium_andersonii.AAC.1